MYRLRSRAPVRGLSLVVMAVLVGGTLTASIYARQVTADQERQLLSQRADEAAALVSGAISQAQAATRTLVAVAVATGGDPAAFVDAAGRDAAVGAGTSGVALVSTDLTGNHVVAARGGGLTAGRPLRPEADAAVRRALDADGFVATPVFVTTSGERRRGSAVRTGAVAGRGPVVYRETILAPPGRGRLTTTQPFHDIEAVVYAGSSPDPAQVLLATRPLPLPGRTAASPVIVGGDRWLLVVAADRPLVGTMASRQWWLLLLRGAVLTVLITALVEVLRRRRAYALALVDERTDILEERTRSLVRDRERLAEAQRIAHIGSWEWDLASDVLSWSDEMYRIWGVEPGQFKPTYLAVLGSVHDDDRDAVRSAIGGCLVTHKSSAVDHRILRPGGEVRWISSQGVPEVDETGKLQRLRGTAQDITDRRRVEEQFRDLLETAPDGIVIVDGDGRIVLVNRQTEKLFGWTRDHLIGQSVETLLPERFRARHLIHRQGYSGSDLQLRPMGADLDLYARRADGTEFPVEISLSPLRTEQGLWVSAAVRDVSERKQAQVELAHQAVHDALTGLPNRVLVAERLDQALARSSRNGSEVAVLFIDLDRFKLINDSRGHAAGDDLLVTVADRLRRVVRTGDVVARFGGDEFVVVCEGQTAAFESALVAERILEVLRDPVVIDGQEIFLSASVGIAVADGTGGSDSLLRDADAAMYRAKAKGRSRSEFFDATMRTEAIEHLETQSALHRAIERDELRVFYQPVVDLGTGAVTGVEALVRWQHPQHGLVSPASFIPLAEETGLIVPIGTWVLRETTAQLARWRDHHWGRELTANVNLAARQLRQPDLVPALMSALLDGGLDPGALCLELTETTFMEDAGTHRETLAGIRDLGVSLAIDDFGTGYSSLTYLKRFPVSVLKIDQAFVRGLGQDASDTAIVKSVIDLAHALGLVVVAEGVETGAQVAHLRELGCDLAQGYFFARPQPPADLERLLDGGAITAFLAGPRTTR